MPILDGIEMGMGTWAWGDRRIWGFGQGYGVQDLRDAYAAAQKSGQGLVDSAEIYGNGKSESYIGEFLRESSGPRPIIATKFMPYPWRWRRSALLHSLKKSLARLGLKQLDLYQIHAPLPPRSIEAWMEPLAEAVKSGLVRELGVSNYSREQMLRARDALAKQGLALASNQVPYSLVRRKNEFNGLLAECARSGIRFIAYSPLGMGMLSGRYSGQNPPPLLRRLLYRGGSLKKLGALLESCRRIGQSQGGKSPSQVALNWLLCKGALPIPGAKTAAQAIENAGALGWRLSPAEVAALDLASQGFKS